MDFSQPVFKFLASVLIGILLDRAYKYISRVIREKRAPKGQVPLRSLIFRGMRLSEHARFRLEQAFFIETGRTSQALFQLMDRALPAESPSPNSGTHDLWAICGFKGDYSEQYYRTNFQRCRRVVRIFSYEAIKAEFRTKGEHYALDGLKLHLSPPADTQCEIEVRLVKPGKTIAEASGGSFDASDSFGLAILLDQAGSPVEAVAHWEIEVARLKDVLSIEGIVLGRRQAGTLKELVSLHSTITRSNVVWSSKDQKQRESIEQAIQDLEEEWRQYQARKGGRV